MRYLIIQLFCLLLSYCNLALSEINAETHDDSIVSSPIVTNSLLGRDFGILVGDVISHQYTIITPKSFSLNSSSLPSEGKLNYWLELNKVTSSVSSNDQTNRYTLSFDYQTFYAPLDVHHLVIPAIELSFSKDKKISTLTIPAWSFISSPLKELTPSGGDTSDFMQVDIAPEKIDLASKRYSIYVLIALFALLFLLWLYLAGHIALWSNSPFHVARHQINKLNKQSSDTSVAAIQALHCAFNNRAGHIVFTHQLDLFLEQQAQFDVLSTEINDFFQLSDQIIFMGHHADESIHLYLITLCRQLAAVDKVVK